MAQDLGTAVRAVCLSFPEAEEFPSHGSPNFRVRGKTFATFVINLHGDGRVALWINLPAGAQEHYVRSEPKYFFVPSYVGPAGWLGMHLNKGLSWKRIAALVRQAYEKVAPRALADSIGDTIEIRTAVARLAPSEIDPLKSRVAAPLLRGLRKLCLSFPETSEGTQFGSPMWRAGRKMFALLHYTRPSARRERIKFQMYFWVGVGAQGLMTADRRFEIPAYIGHNGWIALDVTRGCDWSEVRALALQSYRHFALRRMLAAMAPEDA